MSQGEIELCVVGDFAWDVLIRTNTELLRGGDTFGEVMLMPGQWVHVRLRDAQRITALTNPIYAR